MKICTITYHEVVDNPLDSGIQRNSALPYKHSIREFRDHVKLFSKAGIKTRPIGEIDLSGFQDKAHIISFDDGGVSNMVAAEILEEIGLIGHFFITTSFIGKKGFLSADQIRKLSERGHVIGGHSDTHPDIFYRLPYDKMVNEWKICKEKLKSITGKEITCASIPGGEMNADTWRSSSDAGFMFLFCSEPYLVPRKKENWLLGRVCPKQGSDYSKITNILNFKGYLFEMTLRKIKNLIKRIYYPLQEIFKYK